MKSDCQSEEADSNQGLPTNYAPLALEKEIREFWIKNQIREKLELLEKNAKGILGYVEGPPTLKRYPAYWACPRSGDEGYSLPMENHGGLLHAVLGWMGLPRLTRGTGS